MLVPTSALFIPFAPSAYSGCNPLMGRSLRQIGRAVLPARSGEYLRGKRRAWMFSRAMREYVEDPVGSWQRNRGLISELIYGWHNERFSAREEYLRACLRHALGHCGSILECGSGLTTILIGGTLSEPAVRCARSSTMRHGASVHRRCSIGSAFDRCSSCTRRSKVTGTISGMMYLPHRYQPRFR